jgi:C1A family cysteine protease
MRFLQDLAPEVDLKTGSQYFPDTLNQSSLGACVFNACANNTRFLQGKEGLPIFLPSRLYSYWNTRKSEGTEGYDAGAVIADAIKSLNVDGFCPEEDWPYDISKFTQKPPDKAYEDAKNHHAVQYMSVLQDINQMKGCLSSGYPILIGISVYESFESAEVAKTGMVPLPASNEQVLGGHCMLLYGYSDDMQRWKVLNSWGDDWGDKGTCYLPYSYLLDGGLSDDFWTLRIVT